MVSVKLEIFVQKWRKRLFLFALLTWLGRQWSVLWRKPQQHNLPLIFFIKMKMVIFVFVVVVAACACFVVARDGVSRSCALLVQRVLSMWCMAQVSRGCFFLLFYTSSLSRVLLLFSTFSSREIWGMNMPNLLEVSCLEDLLIVVAFVALPSQQLTLLCWWLLSWDEYPCDTHDVLMTPLLRSLARPPCGSKTHRHGSPRRIKRTLVLWALWHFTMMALIASIAIIDGIDWAHCNWQWRCCLLLLVATVPSSDTCIVFTARVFNSLITIKTELSLE